jgi:glycosyltransferase involved in cell wall biosynthesis
VKSVVDPSLRTALASDALATAGGAGGAESVLMAIKSLFPEAPVYTTVYNPDKMPECMASWDIRTSFIQNLPAGKTKYQMYLPFMPTAIEQLNFENYDLVISSNHSVIKGIVTRPDALHLCYCHSPIRYAWDLYHRYLGAVEVKGWQKPLIPWLMNYIRLWDAVSANRVDVFVANSHHVRKRIAKFYRREATVIYPPVATDLFTPNGQKDDGFYLMVGRIVGYKRHDLAVEAFNQNGRPLVIIGDGPERAKLEPLAAPNIRFLGRQPEAVVRDHLQRCRAFIFPGEEDFGIAPVEAISCGRPIIAYGRGGALETVCDGLSGIFFQETTAQSLNEALERAEGKVWQAELIAEQAKRFSYERFLQEFTQIVDRSLASTTALNLDRQIARW